MSMFCTASHGAIQADTANSKAKSRQSTDSAPHSTAKGTII